MARHAKNKRSVKLREGTSYDTIVTNKVDELLRYLEAVYRHEDNIEQRNAQASLALKLIGELSETKSLPREVKVNLLSQIARAASETAERLSSPPDVRPTAFWAERGKEKRYMSPCDFVKLHWPTYGKGLIFSTIYSVDNPLYRALLYYKSTYGWPDDFDLPTKREHYDRILGKLDEPISLSHLDDLPPAERRRLRRLRRNQLYRNQVEKTSPSK